jgi:hypothetical protein
MPIVFRVEHKQDKHGPWIRPDKTERPSTECMFCVTERHNSSGYPGWYEDFDDINDYYAGLERNCVMNIRQLFYWFGQELYFIYRYYDICIYEVTNFDIGKSGLQGKFHINNVISRKVMKLSKRKQGLSKYK